MWRDAFVRLSPRVALKSLETPSLYHRDRDELYELDTEAYDFLRGCDGRRRGRELGGDEAFVAECLAEGLLELLPQPAAAEVTVGVAPQPSLRYLELQLTRRCNLRCRHCYLGPAAETTLPLQAAVAIARDFAALGGLRLLISGGEPLLYPGLDDFLTATRDLGLRRVLLTNGTLLTRETVRRLDVEEVQISLDGWGGGHDRLRGEGSFVRTRRGVVAARAAGIPISLATMIHQGNLDDFPRLQRFAAAIGAREWGIDLPCTTGELCEHRELLVPLDQALPLFAYAYGGGYHGPGDGYACGHHLLTVLPSGQAVKCGFYADKPLGDASREGLATCWGRLHHRHTRELECGNCPVLSECAGGCRFRAPTPLGRDPVMCARYGQPQPPCAPAERHSP